jgi:hypothetical protein
MTIHPAKTPKLKGWIPCADRLPKKGQEVLIYLDENEGGMLELGYTSLITIAIYTGEGDEWSRDWEADANAPIEDGCQPTHWMPLPEPPTV